MCYIYLLPVDNTSGYEQFASLENFISLQRVKRIAKFRFSQDKILSLFSELIIRYDIIRNLPVCNGDISFSYNRFGKPCFEFRDIPFYFSVSHCRGMVAYARHFCQCGIDVENMQYGMKDIADRYFSAEESKYINQNNYSDSRFTEIWTRKEAYLKMKSVGLSVPLNSFNVMDNTISEKIITLNEKDYYVSFCSERAMFSQIKVNKITSEEITDFFKTL